MKYGYTVIAVSDIQRARKFYEELFGLECYQDYGINIAFTCGIALQQQFHWLVNLPEEQVIKKSNSMELSFEEEDFDGFLEKLANYPDIEYVHQVMEHSWGQRVVRFYDLDGHIIEVGESMRKVILRFLHGGLTMEEISKKMDASIEDLQKLLGES